MFPGVKDQYVEKARIYERGKRFRLEFCLDGKWSSHCVCHSRACCETSLKEIEAKIGRPVPMEAYPDHLYKMEDAYVLAKYFKRNGIEYPWTEAQCEEALAEIRKGD